MPTRATAAPTDAPVLRHRVLVPALVYLAILVLMLGWFEIGVRLVKPEYKSFTRVDETIGTVFVPGSHFVFESEEDCPGWGSSGTISSHGLRDVEHEYQKPPGTFRVLVLGDSYVEALMFDLDQTFTRLLERELNERNDGRHYEVINGGRSAMGTATEYLFYENEGRKYHPDLVLLLFVGNDFEDNSRELNHRLQPYFFLHDGQLELDTSFTKSRSFRLKKLLSPLRRFSYLVSFIVARSNLLPGAVDANERVLTATDAGALSPGEESAVGVTRALLAKLAETVQADGSRFALLIGTDAHEVNFSGDAPTSRLAAATGRILTSFGDQSGVPYLDLAPILHRYSVEHHAWVHGCPENKGLGHWSLLGHQLVADATTQFLVERHLVP